jgi:hypothetical protein
MFEFVKSSVLNTCVVAVTLDCDVDGKNWTRSDRKHQTLGFVVAIGDLNY